MLLSPLRSKTGLHGLRHYIQRTHSMYFEFRQTFKKLAIIRYDSSKNRGYGIHKRAELLLT